MATYSKELVRKIVRLLESDHDGESAAAARKLAGMARGQGQNLDEMLAAVYGAAADVFRQAHPSTSGFWSGTGYAKSETPPKQHRRIDEKLQDLREAYDCWGSLLLTAWETTFVEDILDRQSDNLSDKQADAIDKILAKYRKFAARNGDEKAFWGA